MSGMTPEGKGWKFKYEKERAVCDARLLQIEELVAERDDLAAMLDLAAKYLPGTGPFRGLKPDAALKKLGELLKDIPKATATA